MTKKGPRNPTITRNESFASNESLKTIDTSTNQTQEGQGSNEGLNGQTREYIDTVIQSTAAAIMCSMQQMMDQQNENQRQWNSQCMETINQRKYTSINYEAVKEIPIIQGFQNPKAAETERIRLWWVMNWTEGQKMIKMIPQKPSLCNKLWKTVALGAFVNLHEFMQKNLIGNAKEMNEDTALEMADGDAIYIRKRKCTAAFENISEWLLAFKAYMEQYNNIQES
ncbi:hypothetical protein C2G38_2176813 [Gigaspora rosea]|uniref:Uncharacterized protein n=1 Tax=Gigaspora rosea TaxID=44941 RepID=A0A397VHC1_9GLOM|nr:hypothetical protein C2G38_2176813 [Gigaspora rosea]